MSSTIIAIYPGRFQPMGAHHKATYDWAVSTFGYDNTFITSSNKVEPIKSPLSYQEKKMIAVAHGVTENKFVLSRSPYRPVEVFQTLQAFRGMFPQDFSVVFIVGKKDMEEDPRFRPGYKKSGAPSYFQYYDPSIELSSADTHGYLVVAPHTCILLPNGKECSGTNLREYLGTASSEEFSTIMGFYDDVIYNMVRRKFSVQPIEQDILNEVTQYDSQLKPLMDSGYEGIKQAMELADSLGIPLRELPWTDDTLNIYLFYAPGTDTLGKLDIIGIDVEEWVEQGRRAFEDRERELGLRESADYDDDEPNTPEAKLAILVMELETDQAVMMFEMLATTDQIDLDLLAFEINKGLQVKQKESWSKPTGGKGPDPFAALLDWSDVVRSAYKFITGNGINRDADISVDSYQRSDWVETLNMTLRQTAAAWKKKSFGHNLNEATKSEIHRDDLILGTEEYSKYIDELIDDIHHVKKSLKTRSKKGSKHRKESARLQNAIDSLKYMNRKNQRQILDNNRIDERLVNFVAPEEKIVKKYNLNQKTKFTRDEIKSYFYRLKNE